MAYTALYRRFRPKSFSEVVRSGACNSNFKKPNKIW